MPDRVTAIAFDMAIMSWGVFCENCINQVDENGQHPWTLDQLLGRPEDIDNAANFAALMTFMGGASV